MELTDLETLTNMKTIHMKFTPLNALSNLLLSPYHAAYVRSIFSALRLPDSRQTHCVNETHFWMVS